jgi:hypothetical protein
VDQPILEKEEPEVETPVRIEVVVHSPSGTQFPIQLGYVTREQLEGIHSLIRMSFDTLASTRCLTFVDESGRTRHFNVNQITCVEVRTR